MVRSGPLAETTTVLKYLVAAGVGARRACAALIMQGRVAVDGTQVESLTQPVGPHAQVSVDGAGVRAGSQRRAYLLLHKPRGYLSAVSDARGRQTVLDLVPDRLRIPGLVPAGRLDLASLGMMILTNDGDLVNHLTHPRYGVEKEYHLTLDGPLSASDLRRLVSGVPLTSGLAKAVEARALSSPPNGYAIVMTEGRKREVRLMVESLGRRIRELQRVRMGGLWLGDMASGTVRELDASELRALRQPKAAAARERAPWRSPSSKARQSGRRARRTSPRR